MTPRRPSAPPAGFTLVEVLVSTVITAIVIMGGIALLMSQQRMYKSSAGERGLQETARISLGEIASSLRMAGFGVDPPLVIDFGPADNLNMAQAPVMPGKTVRNSPSYLCNAAVTCRDRVDGPDELVFYTRNQRFARTLSSVPDTNTINLAGPLNTPLYKGQILQLLCTTGNMYWAYVTVDAYVAPTAMAAPVRVSLTPPPNGGDLDFPFQQAMIGNPSYSDCFLGGTAMVTRVERYRYSIGTFDGVGNAVAHQTPGSRPYLMLDQGLTDETGQPITTVIAPDVEDLQVSYLFPVGATPLVGATQGLPVTNAADSIDLAPANGSPGFGTPMDAASRTNQSPSNIRGVRISIVARSAAWESTLPDAVVPAAGNRPDLAGLPGYRRMRVETTVFLPNLDSRSPYYPVLSSNNGVDLLNVGGG